ncbi:carbohydrate ABC transporter permease [Paenibacillus eucommiae]|uniref:Aldouronate transport system permease protein n=1 Tax=Paenibacillus eucommiae TaxID=1355755 RepID=A0ABS4ISX3_9BACL|nr:carbohydrate ABC transporter permease [Paenibacillus eucommiae]MBP1990121.1 putative aldouronate transport system permease protein [Paenibacillus eucommiae]
MRYQRMSTSERAFDYVNYGLMVILMLSIIGPFIYVALVSITNQTNINYMFADGNPITFEAYRSIFSEGSGLVRAFVVSFGRTVIGTALNLLVTVLIAYPLSKKYLPGRNQMVFYIVITILFSGGLIPSYLLTASLKLIDSYWVYILPSLVSAWYILLMRNFFMSIPESLEESARIDGAPDLTILFRIILPLSLPALATIGLFYAIGHWNSWIDAIMYMRSPDKFPLQLFLRRLIMENVNMGQLTGTGTERSLTPEAIKNAALLVTTLPIVLVYPFAQKYFVKGIMVGAIKG